MPFMVSCFALFITDAKVTFPHKVLANYFAVTLIISLSRTQQRNLKIVSIFCLQMRLAVSMHCSTLLGNILY